MYTGRHQVQTIHRFSEGDLTKLRKYGWVKCTSSVGRSDGYIEIECPSEPNYLFMVHMIRKIDRDNTKKYKLSSKSRSVQIDIEKMCKITKEEIDQLEEKDIYVVKYDNEKPEIDDRTVWCTIYGDDEDDIYFGLDRIVKLVRGDILRGSKWCGKHYRFSE